eukprot:SAG22_NODE_3047_length_1985_cov_2.118770_1_plen_32_part_10
MEAVTNFLADIGLAEYSARFDEEGYDDMELLQ